MDIENGEGEKESLHLGEDHDNKRRPTVTELLAAGEDSVTPQSVTSITECSSQAVSVLWFRFLLEMKWRRRNVRGGEEREVGKKESVAENFGEEMNWN